MTWGKKGWEMWQLVLLLLAAVIILFSLIFISDAGSMIEDLLGGLF